MALERVKELGVSRNSREKKNSNQARIKTNKATEKKEGIGKEKKGNKKK